MFSWHRRSGGAPAIPAARIYAERPETPRSDGSALGGSLLPGGLPELLFHAGCRPGSRRLTVLTSLGIRSGRGRRASPWAALASSGVEHSHPDSETLIMFPPTEAHPSPWTDLGVSEKAARAEAPGRGSPWAGRGCLQGSRLVASLSPGHDLASARLNLGRSCSPRAASSAHHLRPVTHFTGAVLSWVCERQSALPQCRRGGPGRGKASARATAPDRGWQAGVRGTRGQRRLTRTPGLRALPGPAGVPCAGAHCSLGPLWLVVKIT